MKYTKAIASILLTTICFSLVGCGHFEDNYTISDRYRDAQKYMYEEYDEGGYVETPMSDDGTGYQSYGNASDYKKGNVTANNYVSPFFGYMIRLDSKWDIVPQDVIIEDDGSEYVITNEDACLLLSEYGYFSEFYAYNESDLYTYSASTYYYGDGFESVTEADFCEALYPEDFIKEYYEEQGNVFESCEQVNVNFCGQTHPGAFIIFGIVAENGDVYPVYRAEIVVKNGNYFSVVAVQSFFEDHTNELFAKAMAY